MLMVPDKFTNGKILASASETHDVSLNITPYCHNKKNIVLNPPAKHQQNVNMTRLEYFHLSGW